MVEEGDTIDCENRVYVFGKRMNSQIFVAKILTDDAGIILDDLFGNGLRDMPETFLDAVLFPEERWG